ncbi:hypothetical protein [Paenibacillus sp. QZ-Y1]|uniref:hypothetical protein n=1 Tax=Paenibacillus sp. QZ-Y1 TaxID=3414511 RepID=UPI003F7A59B2
MNLFHIQSSLHGISWTKSFLEDNFVGIAWPAIGDLEHESPAEWKEQLVQRYRLGETELANALETLHTFAHILQDGDYILISDEEWAYVGDMGEYYYDDSTGTGENLICHRRGVTWMGRIPLAELNDKVQTLCNHPSILARFEYPVSQAELERGLLVTPTTEGEEKTLSTVRVDEATIQEALDVLKEALHSEEADLRIRAAVAILQYAKP